MRREMPHLDSRDLEKRDQAEDPGGHGDGDSGARAGPQGREGAGARKLVRSNSQQHPGAGARAVTRVRGSLGLAWGPARPLPGQPPRTATGREEARLTGATALSPHGPRSERDMPDEAGFGPVTRRKLSFKTRLKSVLVRKSRSVSC